MSAIPYFQHHCTIIVRRQVMWPLDWYQSGRGADPGMIMYATFGIYTSVDTWLNNQSDSSAPINNGAQANDVLGAMCSRATPHFSSFALFHLYHNVSSERKSPYTSETLDAIYLRVLYHCDDLLYGS